MPSINITLKLEPGSQLFSVPIAVKVVNSELETCWQGAIPLGQSVNTGELVGDDEQDKHYEGERIFAVQASLPSGRRLNRVVMLAAEQSDEVEIEVVNDSPRESLEWAKLSKPRALDRAEEREEALRSVWLRLWACEPDGRWGVRPWPVQYAVRVPGVVQYEFDFGQSDLFGQYYLQVGGPNMPWRLIALPADDIRVLITGARRDPASHDEADSAVEVTVTSRKHDVEVLLGYLARGEVEEANLVGSYVIADDLLSGKRKNPTAAAIAGYFLLSKGKLEDAHRVWTSNLSTWMKWLPDGAVINAWYEMRSTPPDLKAARRQLLKAATRGVPVYTVGLRLLRDGLALFDSDPQQKGPDVLAVLNSTRRFAAAADLSLPTTTFIGKDPCSPGVSEVGKPADPYGVVFLADPDAEELAWKRQGQRATRTHTGEDGMAAPEGVSMDGLFPNVLPNNGEAPICGSAQVSSVSFELSAQNDTLRSAALGEAPEPAREAQPVEPFVPPVSYLRADMPDDDVRLEEPRAGGLAQRRLDTDERTIARLFRAAAAQTQGEQMSDRAAVKLSPDADETASLRGLALERIIGVSDLLSVTFLSRGLAAARTVGRVGGVAGGDLGGGRATFYATGFLVSPRLLLTNAHVVSSHEQARACFVDFDYQDGPDGQLLQPIRINFAPDTFFLSNPQIDFTLVALDHPEPGREFGWSHLTAEQGKILIGEQFSVVQHARGGPKQISLRANQFAGTSGDFLHYHGDTAPPTSGAPLFNDQWEVIGMHRASVPTLNEDGQPLTVDGTVFSPGAGTAELHVTAHEGVRVSSIVKYLHECEVSPLAAGLRDELLYSKPPSPIR